MNRKEENSSRDLFFGIFTYLLIFFVVSCSQKPAQILNHSRDSYGKNSQSRKIKHQEFSREKKSGNRQIEVVAGDTLFSVSKKHQIALRDLIKQNNLVPPYNLKAGSILIIPSPTYHQVKSGDTIYAISRAYNMNINSLIEMNDLKEPYSLKVGERIRISSLNENKNLIKSSVEQTSSQFVGAQKKSSSGFVEKTLDKVSNFSGGFSWPLRGEIISKFGPKKGGLYNDGINIKAVQGTAVKSAESGVVAYVGNELKGYGNLVIVKHSLGWITAYAHLAETSVERGQKLVKGAKIGTVGATGNVNSPQLYFGLRKGRDAVNPENYLK